MITTRCRGINATKVVHRGRGCPAAANNCGRNKIWGILMQPFEPDLADISCRRTAWPVFLLFAFLVSEVFGAEPPEPVLTAQTPNALQEVIVTAQKIKQDIQVVPISITAISADTLAQQGVHDIGEVLDKVPNLSFQYGTAASAQGVSSSRGIAIRGISGVNTTGFYIDDTPVPASIDPRILDVDHIEVLKGPQGTLYGAASMGGLVKVVTASPSVSSLSGSLTVDGHYLDGGDKLGTFDSVSVNAPVSADSAARLGGYYSYDPGFLTRTWDDPSAVNGSDITGPAKVEKHVGSLTSSGAFATYLWQPGYSNNLTVTPMFLVEKTVGNGLLATDVTTSNLVQRRALDVPEEWRDTFYLGTLNAHLDTGVGTLTSNSSYFYRTSYDQEDGSDVTKYLFGLSTVVPTPSLSTLYDGEFTQELRLHSDIGHNLTTTVGLYFNDSLVTFDQSIIAPGADAASGGALGSDLGYLAHYPGRNYTKSAFGSVGYNVTDQLTLTAGLRYDSIKKDSRGTVDGFYNGGASEFSNTYRTHATTPRYVAQYQFTNDKMAYLTAAKGFRPGANETLPGICNADLEAIGKAAGTFEYQSDSLWNYEGGAKTRWLDGRLLANIAVYDMEWTNIQQVVELPTCGFQAIVNGAKARSQGSELELALTPIRGLTFGSSAGYEDAKITGVAPNSATLYVGQPLNGVPKWTVATYATYEMPTERLGALFFRADYDYVGESESLNNSPLNGRTRPAYNLVNLKIGTTINRFQYSVYAKNILNEHPNLGDMVSEIVELPGRPRYIVGNPFTIGIEVQSRF